MIKKIKELWQYADGAKTLIAALYWGTVMPSLLILYPNGTPPNVNKWCTIAGLFLTSVGAGHKFYKRLTVKNEDMQ